MKTTVIGKVLAGVVLATALSACDPLGVRSRGDLMTETRSVANFHALEMNVPGKVEMRIDSVFRVEVTCEESVIAYLETYENNGVLNIHFDRDVFDVDNLRVRVWVPHWDGISVNGSADVDVPDPISGDQLCLSISGSGDVQVFSLDFNELKTSTAGSGDITISGQAERLDCSISGSGQLDAVDCPVKTAVINITGSGDARVDVSENLKVTISGSGDVGYQGSPEVTSNVSGSGRVYKL